MADLKITELSALTTPNDADLFVIVDDVSGTATTKKITLTNAMKGITVNGALGGTTWTGTGKISTTITTEQLRLSYDATNYATWTVAADGALTLVTVDAAAAAADINFNPDGKVGIKNASPGVELDVTGAITASGAIIGTTLTGSAKLSTIATTEQFRLGYDATNYLTIVLLADGHTTFTTVDSVGAEADINFAPDGNVGIKTAAPSTALEVTGVVTISGGIILSTATTTAMLVSGVTTEAIDITGNSTRAINIDTGTFGTGIELAGTFTTAGISMDAATFANGDHEIQMRNTVAGDKTIIAAGAATDDAGIVTAVGADVDIADGSLYISSTDGAGVLFIKKNDVWTAITTA